MGQDVLAARMTSILTNTEIAVIDMLENPACRALANTLMPRIESIRSIMVSEGTLAAMDQLDSLIDDMRKLATMLDLIDQIGS